MVPSLGRSTKNSGEQIDFLVGIYALARYGRSLLNRTSPASHKLLLPSVAESEGTNVASQLMILSRAMYGNVRSSDLMLMSCAMSLMR